MVRLGTGTLHPGYTSLHRAQGHGPYNKGLCRLDRRLAELLRSMLEPNFLSFLVAFLISVVLV